MGENEQLIEEMLRSAEKAEEPGDFLQNRVIHEGDTEIPTPMIASSLKSAGYVYIYEIKTGEVSLTNRNMLPTQLKKRHEDGSLVFTTVKPDILPKRGNLKCMLHHKDPNRVAYDRLGLAVCEKDNLTSPFQVRRHMQKRHPVEWQTIEEERTRAEKADEVEFRKLLLKKAVEKPAKAGG